MENYSKQRTSLAGLIHFRVAKITVIVSLLIGLLGCEEDRRTTLQDSIDTNVVRTTAIFDPAAGVIPFPNNILFLGSQDGSLNIPVVDPEDQSDPKVAMNSLDGFSTTSSITTTFDTAIDISTIPGNVHVYLVSMSQTYLVTGVIRELVQFDVTVGVGEYAATVSGNTTLVLSPLVPLAPKSGYLVVITKGLADTNGVSYSSAISYLLTKDPTPLHDADGNSLRGALSNDQAVRLEPLRFATNAAETKVAEFDSSLVNTDIILSWAFTTQSIITTQDITNAVLPTSPTLGTFSFVDPTSLGLQNTFVIYTGTIDIPYFLSKTEPLRGFWKGADGKHLSLMNGKIPVPTSGALTIPVLVTVPVSSQTVTYDNSTIPVAIYLHGITSNRTTVLALADTMASVGAGLVAIDMPLHGVNNTSPFYQMGNERTFDLDFVNNVDPRIVESDDIADPSGTHFINLASLQTSRDNVRQAIFDLFVLTKSIAAMDVDGNGADFDTSKISFIGHSLGAIVGVPFLALESNITQGVIAMGGGGVAKILDGSAAFGPVVSGGLAAKGVLKGTSDYETFLLAAQTLLDSVDPLNYGAAAVATHDILALEIVGEFLSDGTIVTPSDLVIPNRVPDGNDTSSTVTSPLAGTEPMIGAAVMNLTQIDTSTIGTVGLDVAIKYKGGHHSSILTPFDNVNNITILSPLEVYTEIHANVSSFLDTRAGNEGQQVTVIDPSSVIVAAP